MNDTFRDYLKHGWVLCQIAPGAKAPKGADAVGWQTKERGIRDPNIGLALRGGGLCHAWSRTCAIDVDDYEVARPWLAEHGVDLDALMLAPDAVQITSGRVGRAKLLYTLDEPLATLRPTKGLEFRCASKDGLSMQDVLPPTIHPDTGAPYRWAYNDELLAHWSAPPPLPEPLRELWLSLLTPIVPAGTPPAQPMGLSPAEIKTLLEPEDPDCGYQLWFEIGAAIHHETRGTGLHLWDDWSARGKTYRGAQDLKPHWDSFRLDHANPITLRSLLARRVSALTDFALVEPSGAPAAPAAIETPADVMWTLVGSKVVYINSQAMFYHLPERRYLKHRVAVEAEFLPVLHKHNVFITDSAGKPTIPNPWTWLLRSPDRRDVRAVGMHPGQDQLYTDESDGQRYVNSRPKFLMSAPIKPTMAEIAAFDFLWSRLVDAAFGRWLRGFFAYALLYPGHKILAAPLLVSETTGTGKTTLMTEIPKRLFGGVTQISESQLRSNFNEEVQESWWISFDEIYAGNTKSERRAMVDKVKGWITNSDLPIHGKGKTPITIPNRLQVTASSNHLDALQLDDADERRWGVCGVRELALTREEGETLYTDLLGDPDGRPAQREQFKRSPGILTWLMLNRWDTEDGTFDAAHFNPKGKAPVTSTKRTMVQAGYGEWETLLERAFEAATAPFDKDLFFAQDIKDQLLGARGPNHIQLSTLLRRFGCVQVKGKAHRWWAWRNIEQWAATTESQRTEYVATGRYPFVVDPAAGLL